MRNAIAFLSIGLLLVTIGCAHGGVQFAYVISDSGVSAYTIDATSGALKPVAGSPFAAGSGPISIAVDPTGKFAYVANISPAVFPPIPSTRPAAR